MTETFAAALVGAPFGVRGWVKVRSLSGETEHLLSLKTVLLRQDGKTAEYAVEGAAASPLSFKLAGFDSPEAVKTLQGAEIVVPREQAAPLSAGEFYVEDLRGLNVYAGWTDGDRPASPGPGLPEPEPLGTIAGVLEGGGGFLAEILLTGGEKKLVPFRDEFFGPVDLAGGRIGLLVPWILE